MVQETVTGIGNLIKAVKEIEPATGIEINEILTPVLKQPHVDTIMGLIHSKVALGASGSNSQKQMIKFLDNYLTEQHWQVYADPNVPHQPQIDDDGCVVALSWNHHWGRETFRICDGDRNANGRFRY